MRNPWVQTLILFPLPKIVRAYAAGRQCVNTTGRKVPHLPHAAAVDVGAGGPGAWGA